LSGHISYQKESKPESVLPEPTAQYKHPGFMDGRHYRIDKQAYSVYALTMKKSACPAQEGYVNKSRRNQKAMNL
jgi:hypothetical protein